MIRRCHNPNVSNYRYYGARGISVCDEWRFGDGQRSGFELFLSKMGPRDTADLTIERKDFNGNYCAENCCWLPKGEQYLNRRKPSR